VQVHFYSRALHERRSYLIYLPPGYTTAAAHGRRFPVMYSLHAPPGRPDGYVLAGGLGIRMDALIAAGRVQPFLAALPYGKSGVLGNDTEWANTKVGAYESFVLDTVRAVDSRWATEAGRRGRGIAGLSEGGYGAANIALHHPGVFGVFESWSGYFEQTPTLPFAGASPAVLWANSPSAYVPALGPLLRHEPMGPTCTRASTMAIPRRSSSTSPRSCERRASASATRSSPVGTAGACGGRRCSRCSSSRAAHSEAGDAAAGARTADPALLAGDGPGCHSVCGRPVAGQRAPGLRRGRQLSP
jgi:Putative esterase